MLKLFSLTLLFITHATYANLNLGKAPLGESRLQFSKKDLTLNIKAFTKKKILALIDYESLEWVRFEETLLIPKIRIKLKILSSDNSLRLEYKNQSWNFQSSKNASYSEIYYSLYENDNIKIKTGKKLVGEVGINFKPNRNQKLIIDYTCSRNAIEISGLENEAFTIGCSTRRIGKYGKERPMLEIHWISPELTPVGSMEDIHSATFLNNLPVNVEVENKKTKKRKLLTIRAKIPKRLHRLFTAYGLGPYSFMTKTLDENQKVIDDKNNIAPALFFYLNYKISETNSIRGFDAAIFKESTFNNAGLYLGSDFGHSLDNKLHFTTLLGVQYLHFQFDKDSSAISEPIFPQGIEFMYRHAFDIPNYIIAGGVFLSTSETIDYENIWIRWGKNYFWELNLISWGKDNFEATTWGLSIGFPFKGFL